MNEKRTGRFPRRWLITAVVLFALHAGLLPILSQGHIVASLLGGNAELWRLGVAGLFVLVRLVVVLLLPGLVVARLGLWLYDRSVSQ